MTWNGMEALYPNQQQLFKTAVHPSHNCQDIFFPDLRLTDLVTYYFASQFFLVSSYDGVEEISDISKPYHLAYFLC